MRNRDGFRDELAALDPALSSLADTLWEGLGEGSGGRERRLQRRVWRRLLASRSTLGVALALWGASWRMLLGRKAALLCVGMLSAIVVGLSEPLIPGHGALTWWGLLAPWTGFLALPLLARPAEPGPWADWEAAAPVDPVVATTVLWFTVLLGVGGLILPVSWMVTGSISLGSHLGLIWLGPYALTSLATVLLAPRTGVLWAMVIPGAFWSMQLVAGAVLGWNGAGAGWLWFLNLRGHIWPDGLALAIAIAWGGWQITRRAVRWTFA